MPGSAASSGHKNANTAVRKAQRTEVYISRKLWLVHCAFVLYLACLLLLDYGCFYPECHVAQSYLLNFGKKKVRLTHAPYQLLNFDS